MDQIPSSPDPDHSDLRLTFASGGWVLLVAGLLGLWLLLHLLWPLLSGKAKLEPEHPTPEQLGYDLSTCLVPKDQIVYGAPADSIPPLVNPKVVKGSDAAAITKEYRRKYHHKFVVTGDRVIGVTINGESRAYQLKILQWHEVCNDVLGGVPIAVTYSPLSDSVAVYERSVGSDLLIFKSSGFIYDSNSLLADQLVAGPDDGPGEILSTVQRGERWYNLQRCFQCHSLDGTRHSGPSFKDLYGSVVEVEKGTAVTADTEYLRVSILQPQSLVVKGFDPIMPSFRSRLDDKAVDSIVAYLKSLSRFTPRTELAALTAESAKATSERIHQKKEWQDRLYDNSENRWAPQLSSLYSQLDGKAKTGWAAEYQLQLKPLPCELTHWGSWLARHPDTTLLSTDTGINRDYTQNAYGAYYDRMKLRFPVGGTPAGTEQAELFDRMVAWREGTEWVCRSYAEVKAAAGAETGTAALVYEPYGAGMEPDSVRLADPNVPVVYGLRFAMQAFGYCRPGEP